MVQEEENADFPTHGQTSKKPMLDPNLTQQERHRIIAEKRQKRKEEAKLKEEQEKECKDKAAKD